MKNPTLRTISGAVAPSKIEVKSTALLIIDFQNEYFSGKLPIPDGASALHNARRLVAFADESGMAVFHIQHVAAADSPIFAKDGDTAKLHDSLLPAPHHTLLTKTSVSVFPTTDIDFRLKAANIKTLIIAGLMTHACVEAAARDAVPFGYEVIVAEDACATRDLDTADGSLLSYALLHRASMATIGDAFGDVMATQRILQLALV